MKPHVVGISEEKNTSLSRLEKLALRGNMNDVTELMALIHENQSMLNCKKIDYCLGLVESSEGITVIRNHLFTGNRIQRNYAALWFKRKNCTAVLKEAFESGCIDEVQAFSR